MQRVEWEKIKDDLLEKRSSTPFILVITFDIILLIAAILTSPIALHTDRWWHIPSVGFLTLALLQIYLLKHEATHSTLCQNRKINNFMGHVFGWMILMPFLARQRSHLLHHSWTGHPSGDPSNARMIRRFTVMTEAQKNRLEFVWKTWFPMLAINDRIGLWLDPFLSPSPTRSFVCREKQAVSIYGLGYFLFAALLIHKSLLVSFIAWYLPALFLLLIVEEIINLPHHAETPLLEEQDRALPFWKQEVVTHSCKSIPIWSKHIILNFNLHTAHHYFPMLPWNLLPAANESILESLKISGRDHTASSEIAWSLSHRRAPLLSIMGHYFDRIEKLTGVEDLPIPDESIPQALPLPPPPPADGFDNLIP
jgi:fatty acid desaturase